MVFAIFPRRGSGSKQSGGDVASCETSAKGEREHAAEQKGSAHKYLSLDFERIFVRPFVARLLVQEAQIGEECFGIGT